MIDPDLNEIFVAEDIKTKQTYKLSDAVLCKHSLIVDSIGSEMHSKLLSKLFDHQIAQDAPVILVQYKTDQNKTNLESIAKRLGRETDYIDMGLVALSEIKDTLGKATNERSITYISLEDTKSVFNDFVLKFLPMTMCRKNRSKPLHIIVTHFNKSNDTVWEKLIREARKENIRLTFVYDHYIDVIKTNDVSHRTIAHNSFTQFFFKQSPSVIDLVNSDFRLIDKPSSMMGRLSYFIFKRKYELEYLKSDQCLIVQDNKQTLVKF